MEIWTNENILSLPTARSSECRAARELHYYCSGSELGYGQGNGRSPIPRLPMYQRTGAGSVEVRP